METALGVCSRFKYGAVLGRMDDAKIEVYCKGGCDAHQRRQVTEASDLDRGRASYNKYFEQGEILKWRPLRRQGIGGKCPGVMESTDTTTDFRNAPASLAPRADRFGQRPVLSYWHTHRTQRPVFDPQDLRAT